MSLKTEHRVIGRKLDEEESSFDLPSLLAELRAERALAEEGRNSIILHKSAGLRVVLVAMRKGAKIPGHAAAFPVTVQVIDGSLRFEAGGRSEILTSGRLLTLQADIRHDVEALEEAAFLLTLAGN